jgi:hypothetical protein
MIMIDIEHGPCRDAGTRIWRVPAKHANATLLSQHRVMLLKREAMCADAADGIAACVRALKLIVPVGLELL